MKIVGLKPSSYLHPCINYGYWDRIQTLFSTQLWSKSLVSCWWNVSMHTPGSSSISGSFSGSGSIIWGWMCIAVVLQNIKSCDHASKSLESSRSVQICAEMHWNFTTWKTKLNCKIAFEAFLMEKKSHSFYINTWEQGWILHSTVPGPSKCDL